MNFFSLISYTNRNGIFPGEKLIITMETSTKPLSTKDLELILRHYAF